MEKRKQGKWAQFDFSPYAHVMSASQMLTFEACPRKWWMSKIHKLKEPDKDHFAFGTVFHAVLERYLRADDQGRDAQGNPVNIYPPGWKEEEGKSVSRSDAALIRSLADAAISSGMVTRFPNRQPEKPFLFRVAETPHGDVGLLGFLDVAAIIGNVLRYEDHKTTSNMKYAKTERTLAADAQMLVGAGVLLREFLMSGGKQEDVERIELRHNVVLKNRQSPRTEAINALVSVGDVTSFFSGRLADVAKSMVALKACDIPVGSWDKIPGPTAKDACGSFGGCPFASVCIGRETPKQYSLRIERMNNANICHKNQTNQDEELIMGIFDGLSDMGSSTPPAAPAAPAAPALTTVEDIVDAPALPTVDSSAPPWADPGCSICQGTGFNVKKSRPCKVCDKAATRKSGSFTMVTEDNSIVWYDDDDEVARLVLVAPVKETPEKAATPVKETPVKETPVKETPVKETPVKETPEKKGGRPKKGFFLLRIDSFSVSGRTPVVKDGSEIFAECAAALAANAGVSSYFELPTFGKGNAPGRRDMICRLADRVADQLPGGCFIVARNSADPDLAAFYTALELNPACHGKGQ